MTLDGLVGDLTREFGLDRRRRGRVRVFLEAWRAEVWEPTQRSNLVRDFYELLHTLGVADWDLDEAANVTRLGALARCSQILADFEAVRRRSRLDSARPGEQIGGQDRGEWFYRWLAIHVQNYAMGAYEDFEGEEDLALDAVEVTTIHQSKGLEWPMVFVPSVVGGRVPSSRMGRPRATWYVPTELFDEERYNGTLNDERRLFYVAVTRARDQLLLSSFATSQSGRATRGSVLLNEVAPAGPLPMLELPPPPRPEASTDEEAVVEVTLSELLQYGACGASYRLRTLMGFQPTLAPELGYGRAVHHVLRTVAEEVRRRRRLPTVPEVDRLFDDEFFLPAATKAAHRELKANARALVDAYLADHGSELERIWDVERPFELRLNGVIVSGRADVILDAENGGPQRLTIVDYKTAASEGDEFDFQLQVYADAGREEGLDVRSAFVHDLKRTDRRAIDVSPSAVAQSRTRVGELVGGLRERRYTPQPGAACARCDVAPMCRYRA